MSWIETFAALSGTVGALTGIGALAYSVWSGSRARSDANRSATEAARIADANEELVEATTRQAVAAEGVLAAASGAAPTVSAPAAAAPPPVAWRVTTIKGKSYRLRNIGSSEATGVIVTGVPAESAALVRVISGGGVVPAGHAVDILILEVMQLPTVNALFARWDGDNSQTLPLD